MAKNRFSKKVIYQNRNANKIEKAQFDRKIAKLPEEELMSVYNEVYNIINTEALAKISKKYKERRKEKLVA